MGCSDPRQELSPPLPQSWVRVTQPALASDGAGAGQLPGGRPPGRPHVDLSRLETLSPLNMNLQSRDHLPGLGQLCAAPQSPSDTPGRPLLGKPGPSEDSACRHPQVGVGWGDLCGVIAWPEGGQELRQPRKDTGSSNASQASRQGWM